MNKQKYLMPQLAIMFFALLFISCQKEQIIPVAANFEYKLVNNSYSVPVKVTFNNTSTGASNYKWEFEGGSPATSTDKDPGVITFNTPGSFKVKLEAWNEDGKSMKEVLIKMDSAVVVNFDTAILFNSYAPATVKLTNNTIGATSYKWTFENGNPATSNVMNPGNVVFSSQGTFNITLQASNGRDTQTLTKKVIVALPLSPNFDIVPSFDDEDYEAPLTATLNNTSISALNYKWTSSGGVISNANSKNTTIYFANPGSYTVYLNANNNKDSQIVSKTINVLANKNIRTHTNVRFGIGSAQSTEGAYYSTKLRKRFSADDNLDTSGKWIDLAFYGLSQNFTYNKFMSPDSAQFYTYNAIPQARKTLFINSQENCMCSQNLTAGDFDNMTTDTQLQSLNFNLPFVGWPHFTNSTVPRIILFQTHDGRKGAIKVKQFVVNGANSYILTDIKIQKNF